MIGSQLRLRQILAPAVLLGPAWWVLDHVLPELLHDQLQIAAPWLAALATVVGGVAVLQLAWHWFITKLPPPWLARPIWRTITWLKQRPSVGIITAAVNGNINGDIVESCAFHLTLGRNLTSVRTSAIIDFESADLVLTQVRAGKVRRLRFSPTNTGGLLSLPVDGGASDTVMVVFVAIGLPFPVDDAPEFHGDYHLELTGIRVRFPPTKSLEGELPRASWDWFSTFHGGASEPSIGEMEKIQWPPV